MGSIPTGGSDTPTRFRVGVFYACLLLVVPRVLRAPSGPAVGPGCSMCPWAAARPRDRHTRACGSEWSISRPALALPPPTGTAARPRVLQLARALRSLRRPPHRRRCVAVRVWARRLEARFWLPNSNSARNSRFTVSNFEFVSLELQRFREVLNNDRDKLRAKFIWRLSHRCAWSSAAGSTNPSAREAMGVLRHAKPSSGVSSACRSLGWRHSPRLVAVSSQFAVVSWPNCRPIG